MPEFWADITVKIVADSLDEAEAIQYNSAQQMTAIYDGQIKLKEINVDSET